MNREALRQQMLVRALWRDEAIPEGWLRTSARATVAQALAAYRGNAAAMAERALGASFPTVAALVGSESFAALARHFWHVHPPERGDLGEWGGALPRFITTLEQLADVPYLPDCARLDWALHRAMRAAHAAPATPGGTASVLQALAHTDPARLRLRLATGADLVSSAYPIATLWLAHQGRLPFDAARAAIDRLQAEHAFVWRDAQCRVNVQALTAADASFTAALLQCWPLSAALDEAGPAFAFDSWLVQALDTHWLAADQEVPGP